MKRNLKALKKICMVFLTLGLGCLLLIVMTSSVEGAISIGLFDWTPNPVEEGNEVTFSTTSSGSYQWWISDGPGNCTLTDSPTSTDTPFITTLAQVGDWEVCLRVPDVEFGGYITDIQTVTVYNLPPVIDDPQYWTVSDEPSLVDQLFHVEVGFHDYENGGYTCSIDYGDGTSEETGDVSNTEGVWACVGPDHSYTSAGQFSVSATITDVGGEYSTSDYYYHTVEAEEPPCSVAIEVTNNGGSGEGTLPQAVLDLCPGGTITFAEHLSGETIYLSGHIWINKSLTIEGLGADQLTISGNGIEHYGSENEGDDVGGVFWLQGIYDPGLQPIEVNISGVTIRDGRAREGGGIFNGSQSTLVLTDCLIGPDNRALDSGGGISNKFGTLTLNRCTVWGNSQGGGGDSIGGGGIVTINTPAKTTLINSTVSGNEASQYGGGILAWSGGVVDIVHSTVSGNAANLSNALPPFGGGGIYVDSGTDSSDAGIINIQNSIVAGNFDKPPELAGVNPDVAGSFTSLGGNLIGVGTGSEGTTWGTSDQVGTAEEPIDPFLDVLSPNEPGTTPTYALLSGSPAIDEVACATGVNTDQRGVTRPQGDACDVGAYELLATDETLIVLPETIPAGEQGVAYTQQFTVSNATGAVTWSWLDGGLDAYCDFDRSVPGQLVCYTNTPTPVGSYNFFIKAKDEASATGSRRYTLVMNPFLTFDPEKLLMARLAQTYNQVITVAGGAGPYTITHLSGSLPTGISFDEGTDAFTGTPTQTGSFSDIVVQAVDKNGVTKSITYTLTVLPEHLFTWEPEQPTSYQTTNFTALSGFGYYDWDYSKEPDGECDNEGFGGYTKTLTFTGKGLHKVCLSLGTYDPYQLITDEQWVMVTNAAPTAYSIDVDPYIPFPGQQVEATLNFDDDGPGVFICVIDWGDGTASGTGTFDPVNWVCSFPPHAYTEAGTYTITATVTDDEGEFDTVSRTYEVVYLYADVDDTWLASNTMPTTVLLYGYAPLGTDSITFDIVSAPAPQHGTLGTPSFVDCRPDSYQPRAECRATVVYTPTASDPLYFGYDSFDFTVSKDGHTSKPDSVDLYLDNDNQQPTATDGVATVLANAATQFAIYGADMDGAEDYIDRLTFQIVSPPSEGTLSFDEAPDILEWLYDVDWNTIGAEWYQMLTYTPKPGTTALSDSFTFLVNDSHQDSAVATVNLTLHSPDTLHVNKNDDVVDGQGCNATHCSLREAILDAQIGDTIDFTLSLPSTITLTQGELLVDKNMQIQGPGADQLTVSAGFTDPALPANPADGYRVFHIFKDYWSVEVSISGLTIRDGRASEGGGVFVDQVATLIMTDCVIGPNNIVSYAGGGLSLHNGALTMNNCSVVGNHGTGSKGGAGIFADHSELTIVNSTISGNVTNNYGGGILADNSTKMTLVHSTVSGNTANQDFQDEARGGGGGIYIDGATVELWNTIVAGNNDMTDPTTAGHAKWPDVFGAFTSLDGNLIGDGTGSTGWLGGDRVGNTDVPVDPLLGTYGIYTPGHSPLYPLQPDSPAVDSVVCATGVTTDQRGVTRPQGSACDIGAFELEQEPNNSPAFTSTPLTTATQGLLYSYAVAATDQDAGDSLIITAPTKPDWLNFVDHGDGTATLSGTPTLANVGSHAVKLVVTDSKAANSAQEFTIVVSGPSNYIIFLPIIRR